MAGLGAALAQDRWTKHQKLAQQEAAVAMVALEAMKGLGPTMPDTAVHRETMRVGPSDDEKPTEIEQGLV